MTNKIIQIIPYFGNWPEYFDLYLYSCSRNPMITFLFITDCQIPAKVYDNIIFRSISYHEYCEYVSKKLNINFAPLNAYKLCDIRPFLGYIHANEIAEYEFWSYGDIDLCHGDLSLLLTDDNLNKKDLITSLNYHLAGHFTAFRNNDKFRNIAFRIPNWKQKLLMPECIAMDELDMTRIINPGIKYPIAIYNKVLKSIFPRCFHSMINIYNRLACSGMLFKYYRTSPEPKAGEVWSYDITTGRIYDSQKNELPYLHFLFFKAHPNPDRSRWNNNYYKLSEPIESYHHIEFSLNGIKGIR